MNHTLIHRKMQGGLVVRQNHFSNILMIKNLPDGYKQIVALLLIVLIVLYTCRTILPAIPLEKGCTSQYITLHEWLLSVN